MKWNEISEKYPNQFVLLKALKSHVDGDKKIVDIDILVKDMKFKKFTNQYSFHSVKAIG